MAAPEDKKYKYWETCITILLVFQLGLVPPVVAFRYVWLDNLRPLEYFFDIFFLIDIIVILRTALNEDVKDRYKQINIIMWYLKSYMIFDVLATVPHLIMGETRTLYFLKTLRYARIKTFFNLLFKFL